MKPPQRSGSPRMLSPVRFAKSIPIGPDLFSPWPGEQTTPLYWVARGEFELPQTPEAAELLIVADRHYELYLNGELVLFQRNFFNGDDYLIVQRWSDVLLPRLKAGCNVLDVVIRSDPWQNKNYRHFRPLLQAEGTYRCDETQIVVATDSSWSTTILEGWREQLALGGCQTIPSETITLHPKHDAVLAGFHRDQLDWTPACTLAIPPTGPDLLEWTDPPKRIDTFTPARIAWSGQVSLPTDALHFETALDEEHLIKGHFTLETRFDSEGEFDLSVAGPALSHTRLSLNGTVLGERDDLPDRHQMSLPEYLVPLARGRTVSGENTLRLEVLERPAKPAWMLPVSVHVAPSEGSEALRERLSSSQHWTDAQGASVVPTVAPLTIGERIGATFAYRSDGEIISKFPDSLTVPPAETGLLRSVVLEMEKTTHARLSLWIKTTSPGRIYLGYGFSCDDGVIDCNRMGLRAVNVLEVPAGVSEFRAFEQRTFRFLDMLFEGFDGTVTVSDIRAEETVFVDETQSEFACSDERTQRIWKASLRTAQLCSDELYVDNTEREHAQWADPLNICPLAGYTCFGEYRKARKAFEEVARAQGQDGQIPGYLPGKWFPRIPIQTHMALLAGAFCDYFQYTADESFGCMALPVIERMINHWEQYRTANGLIENLHTVFVDWGSHIYSYGLAPTEQTGPTGALTTMNAEYLGVLVATARMADYLHEEELKTRCLQIGQDVRTAMQRDLFDPSVGVFRDGIGNPLAEKNISQPGNVLSILAGAAPTGQEEPILRRVWNPPEEWDIIPTNALLAWKTGDALFTFGCEDLAMPWLRQRFGSMVDAGSDTLWETWQHHASQCQGSGAGPAYLLNRYVAGLYPAEPGFSVIGLAPHPADLTNLRATCTTPHGPVKIAWRKCGDTIDYELTLPESLQDRPIQASPRVHLTKRTI